MRENEREATGIRGSKGNFERKKSGSVEGRKERESGKVWKRESEYEREESGTVAMKRNEKEDVGERRESEKEGKWKFGRYGEKVGRNCAREELKRQGRERS